MRSNEPVGKVTMAETARILLLEQTDLLFNVDLKILNFISLSYFVFGLTAFGLLVFGITAPYGRYSRAGWGLQVNGKLAWFVQEIPSFLIPVFFLCSNAPRLQNWANCLLLSLYVLHYFQRACVFPFLIRGGKDTPFFPFALAFLFCVSNGFLQSGYLLYHANYGTEWYTRLHIYIGIVMFILGMAINIHSDHILRNLRKPGEKGYKIPKGGMFDYVSGANFFGEILEWAGFAVATWSLPGLAFSFFTCCNIGPRAYQHHKFYVEKFEDYPKDRKALIPFIF